MPVKLTKDAERERAQREMEARGKPKYEYLKTTSIVQAVRYARDNGWEHNKVQVRREYGDDALWYFYVEPYEPGCGCKSLLRYKDYYGPE
jgi:hypothetical protein